MSKRVLFISYDGLTDPLGQSQVLPYVEGLARRGFAMSVLSFEKQERRDQVDELGERLQQAGIDWHQRWYHPGPRGTLADWLGTRRWLWRQRRRWRGGLVHCRGHHMTLLLGMPLARWAGARLLYDLRGFWADERFDSGSWQRTNWRHRMAYRWFKGLERRALRRADHVNVLTHRAKHYLGDQGLSSGPISVVPCVVDTDTFVPAPAALRQQMRTRLGYAAHHRVFVYLGSLGTWYMLPEMMAFFATAHSKDANCRLLFLTGSDPASIWQEAQQQGLNPGLIQVTTAPRSEVPSYLAAADWGLFFIKPVFSKMASSPTKHGELLACGLPSVTNGDVGDMDSLFQRHAMGQLVDGFDTASYAAAFDRLAQQQFTPEALHALAEREYSLATGLATYEAAYRRLLAESLGRA